MGYKKNTASQNLTFVMLKAADGTAMTGITDANFKVASKRNIDNAGQTAITGTFTESGGGEYNLALSQADTNGLDIGFLFFYTAAIPINIHVHTDAKLVSDLNDAAAPPTAAAVAAAVWQDATAGDFTTAHSIGLALYIDNHAPGATSGHAIVGSAMTLASGAIVTASFGTCVLPETTKTAKLGFSGSDPYYVQGDTIGWKGAAAPAMTGDAWARLGTPAGESIAADIAAGAKPGDQMRLTPGQQAALSAGQIPRTLPWVNKPAVAMYQATDELADAAEIVPLCAGTGVADTTEPTDYFVALHGTSPPSWVDGEHGRAVQLVKASSQYIDLGYRASPTALPFTVAIRFRPDAIGSVVHGLLQSTGNATLYGLSAFYDATGHLVYELADGGGATPTYFTGFSYYTTRKTFTQGQWYDVVFVCRSKMEIEVWVSTLGNPPELWGGELYAATRQEYAAGTGNATIGRIYSGSAIYGSITVDAVQTADVAWTGTQIAEWCADPWRSVRTPLAALVTTAGLDNDSTTYPMALAINGINSPAAVYDAAAQRTFIAWQDTASKPINTYFDHQSRTFGPGVDLHGTPLILQDTHGAPALMLDADGYLWQFYGCHGVYDASQPVYYRVSVYPHDNSDWGDEQTIAGNYTYPQPFLLDNDDIGIVVRSCGHDDGHTVFRKYVSSAWSAEQQLTHDRYPYHWTKYDLLRDVLHVFWQSLISGEYQQWDEYREGVYYLKTANKGTTWVNSAGVPYTSATALPVTNATGANPCERVINCGHYNVNYQDVQLDSAGYPLLLYCHAFPTYGAGSEVPGHIKFVRQTGSGTWGTPVDICDVDNAFDSAALRVLNDQHLLAYVTSGASSLLLKRGGTLSEYESLDGGATWALTRLIMGGDVCVVSTVFNAADDGQAEIVFAGGDAGLGSLYLWGSSLAAASQQTLLDGQLTKYDALATVAAAAATAAETTQILAMGIKARTDLQPYILPPFGASVAKSQVTTRELRVLQHSAWKSPGGGALTLPIVDETGTAIDLRGKSLALRACRPGEIGSVLFTFTTGSELSVSASDPGNEVLLSADNTHLTNAGKLVLELWNTTDGVPVARYTLVIEPAMGPP